MGTPIRKDKKHMKAVNRVSLPFKYLGNSSMNPLVMVSNIPNCR
jgi:hypothetical protein